MFIFNGNGRKNTESGKAKMEDSRQRTSRLETAQIEKQQVLRGRPATDLPPTHLRIIMKFF